MKISVKLEVSESNGHHTFDLDDLGVTEQEWDEMSESEKHDIVEKAVFDLRFKIKESQRVLTVGVCQR